MTDGAGSTSRPPSAAAIGHLRLQGRQGVDAAHHPARAQGPRGAAGPTRPHGRRARRRPGRARPGWRRASDEAAELGLRPTQPYVVIVGGGQGGIALGARLRQLGVPTIIVDSNARPGDQWRKRYKSLCLHDPVWYDHLPVPQVPRELAGLLAEGQDRRLAGDVHAGDGAQLLELDDGQERDVRRGRPASGPSTVERDGEPTSRCGPKQLVLATGMSGKPNVPDARRAGRLPAATSTTPADAPRPGRATRGKKCRGHRLQQLRARHLRARCGRTAPT